MVFPSPGCQTCRRRRVKCDCTRPICSRCSKGGRSCAWDGEEQSTLRFRNENVFARGQPRKPRHSKQTANIERPQDSSQKPEIPSEGLRIDEWAARHSFGQDEIPDMALEYTTFIKDVWSRSQPDSSLRLALSAYHLAGLGRARRSESIRRDAIDVYAKSLLLTNEEMKTQSVDVLEQTLLATMLMGHLENILFDTENNARPRVTESHVPEFEITNSAGDNVGSRFWQRLDHQTGAAGILKLRQQLGCPQNSPLHRAVRRQIIRINILKGVPIPCWLTSGADYGEEGPVLELDKIMVRIAALRQKGLKHLDVSSVANTDLGLASAAIAAQAEGVELSLETWRKSLPEEWTCSERQLSQGQFAGQTSHEYSSLGHATILIRYRAVRLINNSIRKRALTNVMYFTRNKDPSVKASRDASADNITALATQISDSVPYFFTYDEETQSAGSYHETTWDTLFPKVAALLAWPLTVAISTESIPDTEVARLRCRLGSVAKVLGDGVLECVALEREFKF